MSEVPPYLVYHARSTAVYRAGFAFGEKLTFGERVVFHRVGRLSPCSLGLGFRV